MDNTGNRRELVSTSISPHSQKVSDRSTMTFYKNGKLTTEISAQGYCHVFGAQATHMAQFDQTQEPNFFRVDEANTVLGMRSDSMSYSPYGYLNIEKMAALLGFNGQRRDLLTQGYLLGNGHRLYITCLMRFGSPDTFSPFDRGGVNAYAYCQNDPINKVDPSGNIPHYLRSVAKWIGNITGLRKPSSNPGGTLSIINEPGVRDKIFSQLPAKDLGNLASTSKAFHLEIGELSIKNVKKLDANLVPAAIQGKVEGILPIDTKRKRALHNSVIQKIENLPIQQLENSDAFADLHPGAALLRINRNNQKMLNFPHESGVPIIDPVSGRRNAIRLNR
ncbi:RHS repeat-associated core domain-containing protein [Pseudomonas shirazica]|nr:RHS repeat-associated core domain-containing protein [Pseudomonas shirazica]